MEMIQDGRLGGTDWSSCLSQSDREEPIALN